LGLRLDIIEEVSLSDERPTLKNIAKEVLTDGYLERARERSRAAKSWWDLVFMPIGLGGIGLFAFNFFKLFWWIHVLIYPGDADRQKILFGGSITLAGFLMIIVPLVGAVPLGFMASNGLMWLVPWARRASEERAKGVKWATLRESQSALLKMAMILAPIALVCGSIGAAILGR
jgi:hypothetical protein